METTTTTTTTTIKPNTDTTSRSPILTADMPDTFGTGRRRIWLGAVVGAVAVAAIGIVVDNVDDSSAERPPTLTTEQRQLAAELERVATWAQANGLSGLSPASLTIVDRPDALDTLQADELDAIAEAAVTAGLTGLSAASLRPHGQQIPNIPPADLPRSADAAEHWLTTELAVRDLPYSADAAERWLAP